MAWGIPVLDMFDGWSLQSEGNKFPCVSTRHNPSNPAPYGCQLELVEERCNAEDRSAIGGLFETEELRFERQILWTEQQKIHCSGGGT